MPASLLTVALGLSLGQVPYQTYGSYSQGAPAGAETGLQASAQGGQYGHEEMYPYDAWDNWVHGYFQEIPAYGSYHFFRPYNYKHVLSQSQTSGGWGNSPQLPYSHEYFWKRTQNGAGVNPATSAPAQPQAAVPYAVPQYNPSQQYYVPPPPSPYAQPSPYAAPGRYLPPSHVPGVQPPTGPVYAPPLPPGPPVPADIPVMPPPGLGPTTRLNAPRNNAAVVEYGDNGPVMIDPAVYQGADPKRESRRQLLQGPALRTR